MPLQHFDQIRPLIEDEVARLEAANAKETAGKSEAGEGEKGKKRSIAREKRAKDAVSTWHAAADGNEKALRDLADARKEVLGEKLSDDELWQTALATESTSVFAGDEETSKPLNNVEAAEVQRVFDLFQEYRGAVPSVDHIISPKLQLELYRELTDGLGGVDERYEFMRRALDFLTDDNTKPLRDGLLAHGLIKDNELDREAVEHFNVSMLNAKLG